MTIRCARHADNARGLARGAGPWLILAGALCAATAQAGVITASIHLNGGTLIVPGTIANADVYADGGGTLRGTGNILGTVRLTNPGTMAPGGTAAIGTLGASNLEWQASGVVSHRLGADDASSDHLVLGGVLVKTGAAPHAFVFGDGAAPPVTGTTYTLMTFTSQVGFSIADFSYSYIGAAPSLVGQFQLTPTALLFAVNGTPVGLQSFEVE